MVACHNFDQYSCTFVANFRQTTSADTVVILVIELLRSTSGLTLVEVTNAVDVVFLSFLPSLQEAMSFARPCPSLDTSEH